MANLIGMIELPSQIGANVNQAHTHQNKPVLDATTASFTIADETKLDGIEKNANNYILSVANTELGGIKTGTDISIDEVGNVSVIDDSHNHIISNIDDLESLLEPAYGEIYTNDSAIINIVPNGTSYIKIHPFTNIGECLNIEPSIVDDTLIITKKSGVYMVHVNFSTFMSVNNATLYTVLFKNNIEVSKIHMVRKFGSAGDISTGSMRGLVRCEIDDVLDVRCRHNSGTSVNLTVIYANLNMEKIAE